jgi:signal peptidase II
MQSDPDQPGLVPAPAPIENPVEPAEAPLPHRAFSFSSLPPGDSRPRASYVLLSIVTFVSLAADLATKYWAKNKLSGPGLRHFPVLKDHAEFIFAQNPGGAWSFLRSVPDSLRRPFFLVISVAAIVFIISIYRRIRPEQRALKWGLPLALGGAMGNLVDRIRYGYVIDFIDVYLKSGGHEKHWPTFNVADIAIVVGVALMALDMMFSRRPAPPPLSAAT